MNDRVGREAQYDVFAEEFRDHADDGFYNAHYDRPACLGLLGDVVGQRILDAACGPVFPARSCSRTSSSSGRRSTAPDARAVHTFQHPSRPQLVDLQVRVLLGRRHPRIAQQVRHDPGRTANVQHGPLTRRRFRTSVALHGQLPRHAQKCGDHAGD